MRKERHITITFSFQNIKNPRLLPRFSDRLCRGSSLYIILRKKGWFKNIKFQEKVKQVFYSHSPNSSKNDRKRAPKVMSYF